MPHRTYQSVRNARSVTYALQFILVFLAYFFTAKWGLALDAVSGFATLVWPPAGIALVALLIFGFNLWPSIALAAFLINLYTGAPLLVALGIATGNTLGAFVSAFALRQLHFRIDLDNIKDGLLFKLFVMVSALIAASVGVSSLWLGGVVPLSNYFPTWIAWWIGDTLGALIVGNLLLNLRKWFLRKVPSERTWFEVAALSIILVLFCSLIFLNLFGSGARSITAVLVYLISPLLIWAALRFGTIGSAFAIFGVSAIAILGTVLGRGPFMGGTLSNNLLLLQVFMASLTVTTMIFATAVEERLRANVRLREANRRMREQTAALSEAQKIAQMGSWQWEIKTNTTTCSDELYHLLDFTQDACRGMYPGILALVSPKDRDALDELITRTINTKKPFEFEHEIVNKHGGVQWIRERGRVVQDELGIVVGIIGTAQEITREKELDLAKTEFIALTSHQLRTPPTGIKWYAAMLLDEDVGTLNPAQRKYLDQISYNNQRMVEVVDTVLKVSQIELGAFQNKPVPTDVCALVDRIFDEFDFEVKGKNITITRNYECGSAPITIDPSLLRIVVYNLISNAVKYTPMGGTIVFAATFSTRQLTITVTDTGRGIPKGEFSNIFQKFFRASNVQRQYSRGTGLGLYIVKRVLDQIKGTINFTSEVGKGTTFSLTIPVPLKEK